jgi:LPLT family lysophospholipid transporter-like MFS transporter
MENSTMLVMIGAYTLIMRAGAPVTWAAIGFGAALSLSIAGLWWGRILAGRSPMIDNAARS